MKRVILQRVLSSCSYRLMFLFVLSSQFYQQVSSSHFLDLVLLHRNSSRLTLTFPASPLPRYSAITIRFLVSLPLPPPLLPFSQSKLPFLPQCCATAAACPHPSIFSPSVTIHAHTSISLQLSSPLVRFILLPLPFLVIPHAIIFLPFPFPTSLILPFIPCFFSFPSLLCRLSVLPCYTFDLSFP